MLKFMPNILDAYTKTKKGQNEFNELTPDAKAKVIEAAIIEKTSGVMAQEIVKGIIKGIEIEQEHIYNDFVTKIDAQIIDTLEWLDEVDKLLSYLRVKHLNYVTKQTKVEKEEGKSNESN